MTTHTIPAQRLYPFLNVDDVRAYVDFLVAAFGFTERLFHIDPDDAEHQHAEAALGDAVVMIGHASPKWGTISPRTLERLPASVYVYVEDVDAHCRRARVAGATIENEPEDKHWGDRMYTARDREGHQWHIASRRV